MIINSNNTNQFGITGEINTLPLSEQVPSAKMTSDAQVDSVLRITDWPYDFAETLRLGEFYILDKTNGQLSLVKGFDGLNDGSMNVYLEDAFATSVDDEDVYIIKPEDYRKQLQWSINNIGASNVQVDGGVLPVGQVNFYQFQNSTIKPILIDATNSGIYVTNAEVSTAGSSNFTFETLDFTNETSVEIEHGLGFPTIYGIVLDGGQQINPTVSDDGTTITFDFLGQSLTGTITYLK